MILPDDGPGVHTLAPPEREQRATEPPDALTQDHWRELVDESAILPEVIAEEDISSRASSLGLPTPNAALKHPNSNKSQYFGIWGELDDRFRPIDLGPGIWFGTHDVLGRLSGQYKPGQPRTAFSGHTVKYEGCRGARPSFAVPVRCREALVNSKAEVFIPEGYKKALALASAGACAISLSGVDAWVVKPAPNEPSEPVDDFDAVPWHGRTVWITFDSDIRDKLGVQYAEKRLTKELESRGAIVIPLRIPNGPDGSKRGIDDYFRDRLAAGVSREDALCELKSVAQAELLRLSRLKREPVVGTDGEQTCQTCPELREQIHEYKAEMELIRRGPVPTAEALALDHLVSVSHNARSRGEQVVPLYVPADAKSAGVGDNTMTRALNQVRRWQDDPETAGALSFKIGEEWSGGKKHLRLELLPLPDPDQDGAGRAKAHELHAIARLPRDATRGQHGNNGGKKIECPKHPDAPLSRTRIWSCTEDDCTWVHQDTAIVGAHPDQDGAGEVSEIHGAQFMTTVQADHPGDRHQDGPDSTYIPYPDQDGAGEPRRLTPISSVSRDDAELAAGPRYWGEAPPEPPPPPEPLPIAPAHHRAWGFRRLDSVPAMKGASE